MKTNMNRAYRLIIGILFLSFGITFVNLKAQFFGQEVLQMEQLQKEIIKSEKKNHPQTVIAKAQNLETLALLSKNFPYLAYAKEKIAWTKFYLDRKDEKHDLAIAQVYKDLENLTWLSDKDRCVLALLKLNYYLAYRHRYSYHQSDISIGEREQRSSPRYWTDIQYIKHINAELKKVFTYSHLFNESAIQYGTLGLLYRAPLPAKTMWGARLGGLVFSSFAKELNRYNSFYREKLDSLPMPAKIIQKELEDYIKEQHSLRDELGAKFFYYEFFVKDKNRQKLKNLYEAHLGSKELKPYVSYIIRQIDDSPKTDLAEIKTIWRAYPNLNKDVRNQIWSEVKSILNPKLDISTYSSYVIGRKDIKIVLRHRHLENVKFELYKVPYTGKSHQYYRPEAGDKPIRVKTYRFAEDKEWKSIEDTISIKFPKTGQYFLRFVPKFKKRISWAYNLAKKSKALTCSESMYVSDKFVLRDKGETYPLRLQWLNASTGQPLQALKVLQEVRSKDTYVNKKVWTTDRNGSMTLAKKSDFGREPQLTALDKSDPLSFYLQKPFYDFDAVYFHKVQKEHKESRLSAFVQTDRPIYKRGQEVKVFGYLVRRTYLASEARVEAQHPIRIKLYSFAKGRKVVQEIKSTTDDYGRFSCSFKLSKSANLGAYDAYVEEESNGKYHYAGAYSFEVEEYQRPSYELSLEQPKAGYRLGSTIKVKALVKEMNGSPLKDCRLTYRIKRSLYSWAWFGYEREEHLPQVDVQSNAEGRAEASIVLERDSKQKSDKALYIFDIDVQATSPTGEVQIKSLQLLVGDELVKMDLKLPNFIDKQSPKDKLRIAVEDFSGNPLPYQVNCQLLNEEGQTLKDFKLASNEDMKTKTLISSLNNGIYTLKASLRLKNGEEVKQEQKFVLWDRKAKSIDFIKKDLFASLSDDEFTLDKALQLFYATPFNKPYIFYDIHSANGRLLKKGLLRPQANKLNQLSLPIPKALDDILCVRLYFVRDAELYERKFKIKGRQQEKKLSLKWSTLRHRVRAGSQEEWQVQVLQGEKPVLASVSAWLYDASLNNLTRREYKPELLASFLQNYPTYTSWLKPFTTIYTPNTKFRVYDKFQYDNAEGIEFCLAEEIIVTGLGLPNKEARRVRRLASGQKPLSIRKDFSETAFCFPKKLTKADGSLALSFTMPESLTRWQFYLVAHTKDLYQTLYSDEIETYRELELKPFMPRFLRSGDEVQIAYSLRNLSDKADKVKVQVQYYRFDGEETFKQKNLLNEEVIKRPEIQDYELEPKEQVNASFTLNIPNYQADKQIGIRITALGENFSDGEEHILAIQGNGVEVQRTQAITVVSESTEGKIEVVALDSIYPKNFKELGTAKFDFSLESNPLLYTIDALPELSPKTYSKNAISLLTNYYSLAVSQKLTKIKGFSDYLSKQSPYLRDSLLSMMENSSCIFGIRPEKEEARYKKLSAFFGEMSDDNFVKEREALLIEELKKLQDNQGNFSWFKGMHKSNYITEYVLMQLRRREQITKPSKEALVIRQKAWQAYQAIIKQELKDLKKYNPDFPKLGYLPTRLMNYLYLSSEMSGAQASASKSKLFARVLAVAQANKDYSYKLPLLQKLRAYYAFASTEPKLAKDLMQSIKEHIIKREDGACFFPSAGSYYWRNPQYALQSEMILYLLRFEPQEKALIRGLKQWLLREKRATHWESSVASLDAIYGIWASDGGKLEGKSLIKTSQVELRHSGKRLASLSGQHISFSETILDKKQEAPNQVLIKVQGEGDVWGMAKLSYEQKMQKVQAGGKELRLERAYYLKKQKGDKIVFSELKQGDKLSKGDIVEVRLYLKLDRAMDFVQVSDPRLLFAEHLDKHSRFVWSYGLTNYFYEVGKEATKFYFDKLARGEYNFSYQQAVVRSGRFSLPNASAESLYAPEYSALTPFGGYQTISE